MALRVSSGSRKPFILSSLAGMQSRLWVSTADTFVCITCWKWHPVFSLPPSPVTPFQVLCVAKKGHRNWHYDGSSRGKPSAGVLAFGSLLPWGFPWWWKNLTCLPCSIDTMPGSCQAYHQASFKSFHISRKTWHLNQKFRKIFTFFMIT